MSVIDINKLEAETKGWNDYCLGYHSIKIPAGLKPYPSPSTNIDWHYPEVARNYQGSALSYIEHHKRFGGAVFQTKVNGWDFVVARNRIDERLVSDYTLVFLGAKKIGGDIVAFTKEASSKIVGDGSEPKYRAFYAALHVEREVKENRSKGFCYDGFVFSGYRPKHLFDFRMSFTSTERHGFELDLSQEMEPPKSDGRPLAPQSSASDFPRLEVEDTVLKRHGYNGVLTRISGTNEEDHRHTLKSLIEAPYGDLKVPVISLDTISDIGPMELPEGKEEFLGVLASIKAN